MKPPLLITLFCLLLGACTRAASTPAPTVLPVNFPTPAPADIAQCASTDLLASANTNGATGAILLGITLTNQTKNPCALINPAQVTLLTASGDALQVQTVESQAPQTPPAPAILSLAPKDGKILSVVWRNFCQQLTSDDLIVRIQLSEKNSMDVPLKMPALPRCDASGEASTISVIPYSDPP